RRPADQGLRDSAAGQPDRAPARDRRPAAADVRPDAGAAGRARGRRGRRLPRPARGGRLPPARGPRRGLRLAGRAWGLAAPGRRGNAAGGGWVIDQAVVPAAAQRPPADRVRYVCPACRADLDERADGVACRGCGARYDRLAAGYADYAGPGVAYDDWWTGDP